MKEGISKCAWIGIGVELSNNNSLNKECLEISNRIREINPPSTTFTKSNRPHLNLYDLDVPEENIYLISNKLNSVLKDFTSFTVKVNNIGYFVFGTVFIQLEKNPLLIELQKMVIECISPFKGQCVCQDYLQPWRKYSQGQREMLTKYGNPFVLNEYNPHITVGFIKTSKDELAKEAEKLRGYIKTDFLTVDNVTVVESKEKEYHIVNSVKLP